MECLLITKSNGDMFDLITEKKEHFCRNDGRKGSNLSEPWELYDIVFAIRDKMRLIRIFGRAGWGAIYIGDVDDITLDLLRSRVVQNDAPFAEMAKEEPGVILREWLSKIQLIEKYSLRS